MFSAAFKPEAKAILRLAWPLIGAQAAGVGMGTVDTIMAGRLGREALAAVAAGSNLNVVFFVFFMGVLMACSPIVAHRCGAGEADSRIGTFAREALWLGVLLATIWVIAIWLVAEPLLSRIGLAPDTTTVAVRYLKIYSFAGYGFCLWFVLRYVAEGVGMTRPILWSGVAGLLSNLFLDWVLMYGKFGFPALGAVGCGWATAISTLLMAAVLALQFRVQPTLRALAVFRRQRPTLGAGASEVLRLGLPIGLILLAEAGLFVLAAMWMAGFGDVAMAAYQIALNFAAVLFMIPLGLGMATTVRVGQALGAGQVADARQRGITGMKLGVINAASNASIMVVFAPLLAALYTGDAVIAQLAVQFLWLAAAFQFFDGLQVTANGALRGLKDTRVPMLITVTAYWLIGMPVARLLGYHTSMGAAGLWWGLTAGLAAAALGLSLRFLSKSARL